MVPSHCIDRLEKDITDLAKNNNFRPKESELVVVYNLQSLVGGDGWSPRWSL